MKRIFKQILKGLPFAIGIAVTVVIGAVTFAAAPKVFMLGLVACLFLFLAFVLGG